MTYIQIHTKQGIWNKTSVTNKGVNQNNSGISAPNSAGHMVGPQEILALGNRNSPGGHQRAELRRAHIGTGNLILPTSWRKKASLIIARKKNTTPCYYSLDAPSFSLLWDPAVRPGLHPSWTTGVFNVPSSPKAGLNKPPAATSCAVTLYQVPC